MEGILSLNKGIRAIVAVLFSISFASAQESRATLQGRLTDASGAALTNVSLTITNSASGSSVSSRSNDAGNYFIPFLLPGTYTLVAELSGFKKVTRSNLELRVTDTVTLDLELTVGDVTESVEVNTPNMGVTGTAFGTVTGQGSLSRQFQSVLKLTF